MAWFNTSSTNNIPQWKLFISQLQQQKSHMNINPPSTSFSLLQPSSLPCINLQIFLPRVSTILSQLKSYNNQLTEFIRTNLYLLIKQSIRIILQLPSIQQLGQYQDQENNIDRDRKHKQPIQGLQFIQGLVLLPNIFTINYFNENLYRFYCKCIFYYMRKNLQDVNRLKNSNINTNINMVNNNTNMNSNNYNKTTNTNIMSNNTNTNTNNSKRNQIIQQLNNSLYKNYFNRLFQIPYTVSQCQTRLGTNYLSITSSILTHNSTSNLHNNQSISSSPATSTKKLSFLQVLISFIDKNMSELDLLVQNIQNQSIINCMNKILMTNGMYNYPYHIKEYLLNKCLEVKKDYIQMLKNMNNNISNYSNNVNNNKKQLQQKIQNILQLQFNIINRSANIYDGIKLFQFIAHINNINNIIYIYSINIVYTNRNTNNINNNNNNNNNNSNNMNSNTTNNSKQLPVPSFIQQHLSQLLLSIVHKDTTLYKASSPTSTLQIQPKNKSKLNKPVNSAININLEIISSQQQQFNHKQQYSQSTKYQQQHYSQKTSTKTLELNKDLIHNDPKPPKILNSIAINNKALSISFPYPTMSILSSDGHLNQCYHGNIQEYFQI